MASEEDYKAGADLVLAAALKVFPDGKTQEYSAQMVNRMRADGCSGKTIMLNLTYWMLDGLKYGNWLPPDLPSELTT